MDCLTHCGLLKTDTNTLTGMYTPKTSLKFCLILKAEYCYTSHEVRLILLHYCQPIVSFNNGCFPATIFRNSGTLHFNHRNLVPVLVPAPHVSDRLQWPHVARIIRMFKKKKRKKADFPE